MTRNRNQPVEVTWNEGGERLLNLVIALINETLPRSTDWIIGHVSGYNSAERAAKRKQFQRDRETLGQLGVHIRPANGEHGEDLWQLDANEAFLPELDLTPSESDVLAAAARWSQPGEMSEATTSALRKLSAAGVRRDLNSSVLATVPDHTDLDEKSVDAIFRALDNGLVLTFDYYPTLLEPPEQRSIEPWAYGAVDGRIYLTGFDLDKQAQRTFRLSRIADLTAQAQFIKHPVPQRPSGELIRSGLAQAGSYVTATVRFASPTGAEELRLLTDATGKLGPVDRDWLIRTAAAYAPEAIVDEPADVRADIIRLLQTAVAQEEGGAP